MGGDPLNVGIVSDGTISNSKVANGIWQHQNLLVRYHQLMVLH